MIWCNLLDPELTYLNLIYKSLNELMMIWLSLTFGLLCVFHRFFKLHLSTDTIDVKLINICRMVLILHLLLWPFGNVLIIRFNLLLEIIMRGSPSMELFLALLVPLKRVISLRLVFSLWYLCQVGIWLVKGLVLGIDLIKLVYLLFQICFHLIQILLLKVYFLGLGWWAVMNWRKVVHS